MCESFAIVPVLVPDVTCRLTTATGTAYHDLPIDSQQKGNPEIIFRTVPDQIHWIVFQVPARIQDPGSSSLDHV